MFQVSFEHLARACVSDKRVGIDGEVSIHEYLAVVVRIPLYLRDEKIFLCQTIDDTGMVRTIKGSSRFFQTCVMMLENPQRFSVVPSARARGLRFGAQ